MSDPVKVLMEMTDETVSAKYIAPILKMNERVIVKYAKDGTWDADRLGKYVISGGHVKFFRRDFLQKCGFMEPEKEELTAEQKALLQMNEALLAITDAIKELSSMMQIIMESQGMQLKTLSEFVQIIKTAGAATPTD